MKFEDIFCGEIPQFSETKKNKVLSKKLRETSKNDVKLKEEKLRIKEQRKEEKEKLSKFMKEWSKKKEDLELENLKVGLDLKTHFSSNYINWSLYIFNKS